MIKFELLRFVWQELWVGMMLIIGNDGAILIDTAENGAVEQCIAPALVENNLSINDIKIVINTHSHGDHVNCNATLKKLTNAKFAIYNPDNSKSHQLKPDINLKHNRSLQLGNINLEIIHTPGHSTDSVCILETNTKTLFCGDSFQGYGIDVIGLPLVPDPTQYIQSIEKIKKLRAENKIEKMYLGHAMRNSNGVLVGEEIDKFLEDCKTAMIICKSIAIECAELPEDKQIDAFLKKYNAKPTKTWEGLARFAAKRFIKTFAQR